MTTTGVRELRQRASELLRRVEAGETIEITDRGRPVAILAPLPDQRPIDYLRSTGDLVASRGRVGDLPEPLLLASGVEPPSRVLERLRRDER
ncbi:MAG: type II toxin-antitoxin system prevent-host-death family antitoxin [Chloroflexi bacterium]|nr:type II toxin-antitoxin system prevent-host-death family antitoxin [Chloroflexota bacterium]